MKGGSLQRLINKGLIVGERVVERLDIRSNYVNIMQVKSHYLANYFTFYIKIGPTSGQKFPKIIMAGGGTFTRHRKVRNVCQICDKCSKVSYRLNNAAS